MNDTTENSESIFNHLYDPFAIPRRKMVPVWIKIFCGIFIALSFFILFIILRNALNIYQQGVQVTNTKMSLYGLQSSVPFSIVGFIVMFAFFCKAVVGYGLLREKKWAVSLGMIEGTIGFFICFVTTLILPFLGFPFRFGLDLILLIPYLYKLWKIRPAWEEDAFTRQQELGIIPKL